MDTKVCSNCHKEKLVSEFHKRSDRLIGTTANCKDCRNARGKLYRSNPEYKEYHRLKQKEWKANNFEKELAKRIFKFYRLTLEQYKELLKEQNNCCAICKVPFGKPYIDHSHTTSKVRGLLCYNCNTGLGQFKDDAIIVASALKYLEINGS